MIDKIIEEYSKLHSNETVNYGGSVISFDGSQIISEFESAWEKIDEYVKKNQLVELSFLEVGAYRGLWGIAFAVYCKLNNIKGNYTTVTLIPQDSQNIHLYKTIDYILNCKIPATLINMNTMDDGVEQTVKKISDKFNIVFIDAGHKYEEVMNDIRKFTPMATDILLFHDIRPKEVSSSCGVYQAIQHSMIKLSEEIITNNNLMGIGIKYIKK